MKRTGYTTVFSMILFFVLEREVGRIVEFIYMYKKKMEAHILKS